MLWGADSLGAWRVGGDEDHLCPAAHREDPLETVLLAPHTAGGQSGCGFGGHHSSGP